jgi:uncharacterized protein involved in response to NO
MSMSELLHIHEPPSPANPAKSQKPAPQWAAFLELGFRPLYIAGAFWAIVAVLLWVHSPQLLQGSLGGLYWHAHEMLWGFIATIAVGFLLTAGANWTGINPLKGKALGALCLLWVLARLGYLLPDRAAFVAAAVAESLFFVGGAAAMARAVYPAKSQRNYGVPPLMLALGAANALFLWAIWQGQDYEALMQRFDTGLLCMALIALLVARRVIPFFATKAIAGLQLPMHVKTGQAQLAVGVLAVLCGLLGWPLPMAVFLAVAGVLALWQVLAWQPWAVRKVPLLWVLYVGYAGLGLGLLLAALQLLPHDWTGLSLRSAWPVHLIGVGGFAVLIIGMITRTALGHLGRPLVADKIMVVCYALVMAAALLRLLALALLGQVGQGAYSAVLYASACSWSLAFALYLWRFVPMLIRPRLNPAPLAAQAKNAGKPITLRPADKKA